MLKLYYKSALRNFTKNKVFVFINVLGLSLGIASTILIFIVVKYDLSFDKYHTNYDNIYRLNLHSKRPTGVFHTPACLTPAREAMKEEFPEVLAAAMVQGPRSAIISLTHQSEEKIFEEDEGVAFVDAEFFEVFDYRLITSGDFNSLDEPNKVLLARKLASKFFRGIAPEEVVGQTIRYNGTYSLQVVGIVEDIPYHTDLPFQMLISQKTREHDLPPPSWGRIESDVQLYLVLNGPIDIEEFDKRINDMVLRNTSKRYVSRMELHLQPFSTIHYDGRFGNFNKRTVSKETIWSIALIGFVLLITACINFINLATAQSIKRAKEIGIRKVMGSNKGGIIAQMLTETTFLVLVASFFGLTAAYLFLPEMANLLNLRLDASYFLDVNVAIFSFILAVAVILLSGFYPGWVTFQV